MNEDAYLDTWMEDSISGPEYDVEPDLDFGFEFDSAMASAGWGTDEDYGSYGGDEW